MSSKPRGERSISKPLYKIIGGFQLCILIAMNALMRGINYIPVLILGELVNHVSGILVINQDNFISNLSIVKSRSDHSLHCDAVDSCCLASRGSYSWHPHFIPNSYPTKSLGRTVQSRAHQPNIREVFEDVHSRKIPRRWRFDWAGHFQVVRM